MLVYDTRKDTCFLLPVSLLQPPLLTSEFVPAPALALLAERMRKWRESPERGNAVEEERLLAPDLAIAAAAAGAGSEEYGEGGLWAGLWAVANEEDRQQGFPPSVAAPMPPPRGAVPVPSPAAPLSPSSSPVVNSSSTTTTGTSSGNAPATAADDALHFFQTYSKLLQQTTDPHAAAAAAAAAAATTTAGGGAAPAAAAAAATSHDTRCLSYCGDFPAHSPLQPLPGPAAAAPPARAVVPPAPYAPPPPMGAVPPRSPASSDARP